MQINAAWAIVSAKGIVASVIFLTTPGRHPAGAPRSFQPNFFTQYRVGMSRLIAASMCFGNVAPILCGQSA